MKNLIDRFLRLHVSHLTVKREFEGVISLYFRPLHQYRIEEVTPLVVEEWFHGIGTYSHSQANKSLGILRTMFEKAKDWRLFTGENPAFRVKKFPRTFRTRFVKPAEMPNLMKALAFEREDVQCFFLLCLLCGCRRGEAISLRWVDLDFSLGVWNKPNTKTGIPHTVPVPAVLLERIGKLPRVNDWVFATPSKRGHWSESLAAHRWEDIRKAAQLSDVTIHDLRRTCASWLAIHGENMAVISKGVLNHSSLAYTGIYARLNVNPVTKALEANSTRMLGVHS